MALVQSATNRWINKGGDRSNLFLNQKLPPHPDFDLLIYSFKNSSNSPKLTYLPEVDGKLVLVMYVSSLADSIALGCVT